MTAADSPTNASVFPPGRPARRRWLVRALAAGAAVTLLAACSGGSSPAKQTSSGPSAAPSTAVVSPSTAASPGAGGARPPRMFAATTAGALVVLNPASGAVVRTLVPSGVTGDEISVAGNGTVYFAVRSGCTDQIESVAPSGGTPVVITNGSLPAISPDGSKLAFASQPSLTTGCVPSSPDLTRLYKLVVRTLSTGAERTYPMQPAGQGSGLPAPMSHLSWSADSQQLAVSIASVQDNEGWNLALVDTATARYYMSGAGVSFVPATGQPNARDSYLREGVYLPDGQLFVSRACCGGFPIHNTSRLMWEVTTTGTLVHQVAVGFPTLDHVSLDVTANGKWLLYLAGGDLYVSHNGATPRKITSGLIAAAWR